MHSSFSSIAFGFSEIFGGEAPVSKKSHSEMPVKWANE
jgi:hypothetical protein